MNDLTHLEAPIPVSSNMTHLEVRNPVALAKLGNTVLAPRLSSLNNKRIALWWNGKAGGDIAVNRIGQLLENKFAGIKLELIRSATSGGKAQLEHAKTFDAVIGATAD